MLTLPRSCGDPDTDSADGAGSGGEDGAVVVLKDIAYKPETVSVQVGDTVVWRFRDKGINHNVVADDGSFRSEVKDAGTFEHTFDRPGTFGYKCTLHVATMTATVEVS